MSCVPAVRNQRWWFLLVPLMSLHILEVELYEEPEVWLLYDTLALHVIRVPTLTGFTLRECQRRPAAAWQQDLTDLT